MTNVLLCPEKKNEYKAGIDWCKSHGSVHRTVSPRILVECTVKRWEQRSNRKERGECVSSAVSGYLPSMLDTQVQSLKTRSKRTKRELSVGREYMSFGQRKFR